MSSVTSHHKHASFIGSSDIAFAEASSHAIIANATGQCQRARSSGTRPCGGMYVGRTSCTCETSLCWNLAPLSPAFVIHGPKIGSTNRWTLFDRWCLHVSHLTCGSFQPSSPSSGSNMAPFSTPPKQHQNVSTLRLLTFFGGWSLSSNDLKIVANIKQHSLPTPGD